MDGLSLVSDTILYLPHEQSLRNSTDATQKINLDLSIY